MKKNINNIGIIFLLSLFLLFYVVTAVLLNNRKITKTNKVEETPIIKDNDYHEEEKIVTNLYENVKILYDVVNNKFRVDQDNQIVIGDIIYKRITNFSEVTDPIFTEDGVKKYVSDLGSYFAYTDGEYYLAGNLVSYQTYYFRGDETNIYITDSNESEINGIIYERWKGNNKNTLATIKVVKENNSWLIDNINILATE